MCNLYELLTNRLLTAMTIFERNTKNTLFAAYPAALEYETHEQAISEYLALKCRNHALKIAIEFVRLFPSNLVFILSHLDKTKY